MIISKLYSNVVMLKVILLCMSFTVNSYGSLPHVSEDSHKLSNDGKLRLDCIAATGVKLTFKLTDVLNKKELWRKHQKNHMDEAKDIFVNVDGRSVVYNLNNEYVFRDANGKVKSRFNFVKDGLDYYWEVHTRRLISTSGGYMWGHEYSNSYFITFNNQLYFVVKTWWNKRVIINFDNVKHINSPSKKMTLALENHEKIILIDRLKKSLLSRPSKVVTKSKSLRSESMALVFLAGQLKCKEAVPFLEKLENDLISLSANDKRFFDMTLRRLGKKPLRGTSCIKNMTKLKVGMGFKEVTKLMGYPDFGNDDRWEYDIDAKKPYTLVIVWDGTAKDNVNGTKVIAIAEAKTTYWSSPSIRDRLYVSGQLFEFGSNHYYLDFRDDLF